MAVATGRVEGKKPSTHLKALNPLIGRWITDGRTIATGDSPSVPIVASDTYEWLPGGFFVMHVAHGKIGDVPVGGIEILGWDEEKQTLTTWFFDSEGNHSSHRLTQNGDKWTWQGTDARATGILEDDGRRFVTKHERSDDGKTWLHSMDVVLTRVD